MQESKSCALPLGDWTERVMGFEPTHPAWKADMLTVASYTHIRREVWDSNPRAHEGKRFSRPPRYNHFGNSPTNYIMANPFFNFCIAKLVYQKAEGRAL